MLLVLALPGVWQLGERLTDWTAPDVRVRRLMAPAGALAALVVAVGIAGRAAGSFLVGLWAGTLVVAAAGFAWTVLRRRRAPAVPPPSPAGPMRAMLLTGLLAVLPVAYLTLKGDFFDDFNPVGHRGLIAQFQNGVFPPRHQVFPDYPFRYHYGFNLVAAILTALFRLPIPSVIDLIVIAGFLWSWCLAWVLGERLTRSGSGGWTALASLLGGGAFFWLIGYDGWAEQGAVGIVIGGNRLNFPVVMYFFQKPFTVGFPLALALVLAGSFPAQAEAWVRRLLITLLLAALYLVQEALFVTFGLSLAAQELWTERKAGALVPFAASVPLATLLGGLLFQPMPAQHGGLLHLTFWPARSGASGVLAWYALTSGLLLPLGLLGLAFLTRLRVFFLLLIAGGFAVPLFFINPYSWDIVKIATVGQFAAGLAGGSVLAWVAEKRTPGRLAGLAVLVVLLVASPLGYLGYWIREMVRPSPGLGQVLAAQRDLPHVPEWDAIIQWLRRQVPFEGNVYATNPRLTQTILAAGLNGAGFPRFEDLEFGIPRARIDRRQAFLRSPPRDAASWLREGVTWAVIGPNEPLGASIQKWVEAGEARAVFTAGPWVVYRVGRSGDARSN